MIIQRRTDGKQILKKEEGTKDKGDIEKEEIIIPYQISRVV
jgi:hypothetical protein